MMFMYESALVTFVVSVRPSAYIKVAPAGRIYVKFDTTHFFENLSRNSKFSFKKGQKY